MEELNLSAFFTTKAQASDFSARISAVSEQTYAVDFDLEKLLQQQFGIKKKDKFMSLLRENNIPIESASTLNKFFEKVQNAISVMPEASLTLAIEPNEELLKAVSEWFLLNLKRQIILEVQIDPNIIAGATVGYQGKFSDGSIKSIFDTLLAESFSAKKDQPDNA